jgi:hypothetical protein
LNQVKRKHPLNVDSFIHHFDIPQLTQGDPWVTYVWYTPHKDVNEIHAAYIPILLTYSHPNWVHVQPKTQDVHQSIS